MLQPGSFPSIAHTAAQLPPALSQLSEGAQHHWKPGPSSSSKGKARTRVVSAQKLLLCRAVESPFPEQRSTTTQPTPGTRGSRESRRKLTKPSSACSLRSLVHWLLQPSPCHLYIGSAATAADSCCHPGPNHTVLSPTETWGKINSSPKASPPATDQALMASSAHAQLLQHTASSVSLAGQQQGLPDRSHERKHVPSHTGTSGTLGTGF